MRKSLMIILASILAAFAVPAAANAKAYQGDGAFSATSSKASSRKSARKSSVHKSSKRASRKYSRKAAQKTNRRSVGKKSSRRTANKKSNRKYAGSSSGSSTGCLTASARNLLSRIRGRFGNVQIVSTCRPGARIATTGKPSKHASGQAIDFRVPGQKAAVIAWLRANHHSGGIMTYRDMDHVHVDIGSRFVALNRGSGRT